MQKQSAFWTSAVLALLATCFSLSYSGVPENIRALTGAHSRIAWMHQVSDSSGGNWTDNVLMGMDTDDGKGERVICGTLSSYRKPILTHDGIRIVFTRSIPYVATDVWVINWDGTGKQKITQGGAVDCMRDPATGIDWAYVKKASWMTDGPGLFRYNLDNPAQKELVHAGNAMNGVWTSVSPDGKRAASCAPWPKIAVFTLTKGKAAEKLYDSIGVGCHAQIAPDNSYHVFHVFSHTSIDTYDPTGKKLARIYLNDLPGWENAGKGMKYYDRWSTDVRFMTFGGPFPNGVKHDATKTEIYIREFNDNLTDVTSNYVRVTKNATADRYAHLWVAKGPPQPTFYLAPASLQFSAKQGGANPGKKALTVSPAGGLSLAGLLATPEKKWLTITISGPNSLKSLTHLAKVTGLAAGTYNSKVNVKVDSISKAYDVSLKIDAVSGIPFGNASRTDQLALAAGKAKNGSLQFHVHLVKNGPFELEIVNVAGAKIWEYRSPAMEQGTYRVTSPALSARVGTMHSGILFAKLSQGARSVCKRVSFFE